MIKNKNNFSNSTYSSMVTTIKFNNKLEKMLQKKVLNIKSNI